MFYFICNLSGLTAPLKGTPIFIARSVSSGKTLPCADRNTQFAPMPTLKGEAKERYISAYGAETYEQWCDRDGSMHRGGPPETDDEDADVPFKHMPHHDVESIFWTFLYALVFAQPADAPAEVSLHWTVREMKSTVLGHTIQGHSERDADDSRMVFLLMSSRIAFDQSLHPALQRRGLGSLLQQLAAHVLPEYAHLDPPAPVDHLHEAFRRILLNFIVDLDAHPDRDISLNPDTCRPLETLSTTEGGGKVLGKRTADESNDGSFVVPASKRTRDSSYAPSAEVNSSRVISESLRSSQAAASAGSKSKSNSP